ncbi:MAG: FAD/NAD(P)-binding protein [candidate division WOR-3 bacterium]|nr:MAG: FAD/NAD(P)-binding protein [candidate division WOR-3 bacterium]
MAAIELVPKPVTIKRIIEESRDVKSYVLQMSGSGKMPARPGQFVEVSVQGYGEATFAVTRISKDNQEFNISVKRIGHLTKMLHRAAPGDIIGVRGPYGNSFPVDEWKGKDIVVIGGGIGLAPLRPVIDYVLEHRKDYGKLEIVFGARAPDDILYKEDLRIWEDDKGISLYKTIDVPFEGWSGRVGVVPIVVKDLALKPDGKISIVCGPPIMIKFTAAALRELRWPNDKIFTTLEMKMQCGIGQCGRCNIGEKFICKDGPVFSLDQIPEHAL